MIRWLVLATLAAGCAGDDDGGDPGPDPATCPEAPFEHCIVHDQGWEVWCENGAVFANDTTAHSYCYPNSGEVACMTGGESITQVHTCATSCAAAERRYFDYFGDYSLFDPATLCSPP